MQLTIKAMTDLTGEKEKKLLLSLTLVLVGALLFSVVPAWAGENPELGKSLAEAKKNLEQELLPLAGAGFVGIAHSEDESEVIVFVEDEQAKQRVPHSFEGYGVRTEVTGRIQTLSTQVAEPLTDVSPERRDEVSPLVGGISLSAYIPNLYYAGTLGMVTYNDKILSCAHVIAINPDTGEFLDTGTPIIQPGSGDGGGLGNQVGELEAYIPINFAPNAKNYADAAIGNIDGGVDASPGEQFDEGGNYWVEGWTDVSNGDIVRKSGRTTGVTTGKVVYTSASIWIEYDSQSAYFVDQIMVAQDNWSFSAPGDSGSAVDKDGEFVGMMFAGSEKYAVISKAEHIIDGLGIAVEPLEGQYSLTISSTKGGEVTTPGEGKFIYDAETMVDLVAEPGEHYHFVKWTGDVGTIADVYAAETTISMYDCYSVTANFELDEGWYSLTISSTEGGEVTTPGEGTSIHAANTTVNLVAVPDQGCQFAKWTGDVSTIADVNAAQTTVTMNDSYSITATFQTWHPKPLALLMVSSTTGGSVTEPGEGIFWCPLGTEVNLVAEASSGYQFANWSGDVDTIADVDAASTTITMDNSYSIRANFQGAGSWCCCVATATYGTPMAEEIQILREFRDEYLLTNPVGKALVEFYYSVSPPMAKFITEHPSLKPVARVGLAPAVAMSVVAVNTTPAEKIAIVGLVALVSVTLAVWATRRRGRSPEYT